MDVNGSRRAPRALRWMVAGALVCVAAGLSSIAEAGAAPGLAARLLVQQRLHFQHCEMHSDALVHAAAKWQPGIRMRSVLLSRLAEPLRIKTIRFGPVLRQHVIHPRQQSDHSNTFASKATAA